MRAADRQHVGVVVQPRVAGRVEVVAQRRPDAAHLVGRDLLALAAATDDDADLGAAVTDRPGHGGTDRRVVDGRRGIGAVVEHVVPGLPQHAGEVRLEVEPGVIGADGDARHRRDPTGRADETGLHNLPAGDRRPADPGAHRRRSVLAPRRRRRRRARTGGADGAGHPRRGGRRRARRATVVRLAAGRQLPVVALRQPGVDRRPAARPGRPPSSSTPRPAGTCRNASSTRRRSTSPPVAWTSSRWSARRHGGRACGRARAAPSSTGRRHRTISRR